MVAGVNGKTGRFVPVVMELVAEGGCVMQSNVMGLLWRMCSAYNVSVCTTKFGCDECIVDHYPVPRQKA